MTIYPKLVHYLFFPSGFGGIFGTRKPSTVVPVEGTGLDGVVGVTGSTGSAGLVDWLVSKSLNTS